MLCLKNLFRAKSARFIVTVCASAFIALAAGISFSCSFLEDDGFFDKIEDEVSVANADKMNVYLRYATIKFGKTTPADAALYQVKNNVAFSVTAVTNSDYAFYRWAAFSTKDFDVAKQHMSMVYVNDDDYYANFGSLELDASVVKFENPRAETTNVTVLQTRDDIWIMPVIAVRPTIAGTFPGTSQTPVRNTKLRVQFSKPMDIESFEGNFIISQATRAADFSLTEYPITEKFKMEINEKGNLVTFSFIDTNEMFSPAVVVRLFFTDDIADSTGYTMADSKTLEWNIGTYVDTLPPLITEMTAGIGSDCSKFASTPTRLAKTATDDLSNSLYTGELLTHRVKNKVNLYVYAQDIAQANGERLESDVLMLGFQAKSITDLEGNAIDGNAEGNFIPNVIDTYAAGQNLSEINGAFRAITGGKSAGCLYTYDLSSLPDGLIQIEVYAVDSTGNDGLTGYDASIDDADGMGNGPRSVFVIKDNRAPAIENELEKIKSSSIVAPFGWYNKQTIDSVEIYDEAANPIRDFGHQKLAAAHENLKWICHLGSSTDWVAEADSTGWVPVSERYKIGAAAVDSDGPVSVTIRLMDDLGNISKAMQISSVLCDNSAPETGKVYCVDASGNQGLNSTKDVVVPESMLIKVPFTEELCGVKVFGLTIKASDGKQVENAFEHASILYSVEESPEKAAAVAIEADTSSLQDVLNSKGNVGASIFPNGIESLHVLQSSYNTGIFYIKNLTLGEADGMYTVTITLYDSALNKAGEKTVMLAHDTMPPVVNRVVIKNVVPRLVYGEEDSTYWLPRSAYDENKDAKYVTVAVTATENGSGVKVITLGENAHITEDTSFIIEGRAVSSDRCTIDAKTNTVTLFDYEQPDLYKQTGSIGFELTNIRLDKPNSEEGNKVSVSLQDFVDNTGSNENAGNFDLYIDDISTSPIYQVFSDSQIPAIAEKSPALADGKADSATDEKTFAEARLASVYTDTKNVDLTLKLSPETNGSGVRSLSLSNGLFTGETAVYVDGKLLPQTEYTLDGSIVTFVNYVFTAANTFKFTNVELQGSDDGLQLISITATDFTGWVSKEVSTPMITLDRAAPVVGEVTWHLKEGVYGVSKAAVVSNMDLCLPFTEVMTGVKVLRMDPKLNDSSSSATPFDSADFAIKYISNADIDALAESAGEGGETKPADTATLIENAKLLKAEADYTVKDNYITFTEPQKCTSGLFVLQNIKVADNFEDNKSYKINLHLADAALNGCAADGTIDLASDSTPPKIQRIFINRLIGRKQPGEAKEDSYWISKEDFEQAGKVPTKVELELTIAESGSGVEKVELGGNLRLTAASEITCGTTKLVKGSDYKVSSDFATITLITKSQPTFRSENGDFTVTITNATLTAEGENKISVKLTDFALNTDPDKSESTKISYKADSTEIGESVFVDFTAPLLAEGGVKIVDRGGSEAINGTADADANTVALEGFTNEKLVNVALKTAASAAGKTKRSGVKHLVISSGARFTSSSKFYYKDLDAADTAALTHADAATNGDGYEEITGVDISSDNLTASLPYSYACEKVCEFIVTNVELTGEEGENQVSIYPVDLTGWSDSEKAVADKITLDTTKPAWATDGVVMGTVDSENASKNWKNSVYPASTGAKGITLDSSGELYFYRRGISGTTLVDEQNLYLTLNWADKNRYRVLCVTGASSTDSAYICKNATKNIEEKDSEDVPFAINASPAYTIVLKDKAGNISETTKTVHAVSDGAVLDRDDDDEKLQKYMEYKDERAGYQIFQTRVESNLDIASEATTGADAFKDKGLPVYYNSKGGLGGAKIQIDLSKYAEKTILPAESGLVYYAVNGSTTAPDEAAINDSVTAWNSWIPFNSENPVISVYPKKENSLAMRLWLRDRVGNTACILIKDKANADETIPDVWIEDNDAPANENGVGGGLLSGNDKLSGSSGTGKTGGFDFEYMIPEHFWRNSNSSGAYLNLVASDLIDSTDAGQNTIYYTSQAKATVDITNETPYMSGSASDENWNVRIFMYPSASETLPDSATVKTWLSAQSRVAYKYGISTTTTTTVTEIDYPECNADMPYIFIVAEDRVGNINISPLKVKILKSEYSGTADYWYKKFIIDDAAPEIYRGGTGADGDATKLSPDVEASSLESLVPSAEYDGRIYNNASVTYFPTGVTFSGSKLSKLKEGKNTTSRAYGSSNYPSFYLDVDEDNISAFCYSHDSEPYALSSYTAYSSSASTEYKTGVSGKWSLCDGTGYSSYTYKNLVSTHLYNSSYITSDTQNTYLHVADKVGHVTTIRLGDTYWKAESAANTIYNSTGTTERNIKDNYLIVRDGGQLTIFFAKAAGAKINGGEKVKVYIPTSWYKGTSGLCGLSWEKDGEPSIVETDNGEECFSLEFSQTNITDKLYYVRNNTWGANTAVYKISSSLDDKFPKLKVQISGDAENALSPTGGTITANTSGKFYDKQKTGTKLFDATSTTIELGTYQAEKEGTSAETPGYSEEHPYVIYSNAYNGTNGYLFGIFNASDKDGNGNDSSLSQVLIQRKNVKFDSTEGKLTPVGAATPYAAVDATKLTERDDDGWYSLDLNNDGAADKIAINLDEFIGNATDCVGKLYIISVVDKSSNTTTFYLEVIRDREGPDFGTVQPKLTGKVGKYNNNYFYNPGKAAIDSDDQVALRQIFRDNGMFADYVGVDTNSYPWIYYDNNTSSTVRYNTSSSDRYKLSGPNASGHAYYLYAKDYLGNETKYPLYLNTEEISKTNKKFYPDSLINPVTNVKMSESEFGRFVEASDSTKPVLYYNINSGYYNGINREFTITFEHTDKVGYSSSSEITSVSNCAKGFYIAKTKLTNPASTDASTLDLVDVKSTKTTSIPHTAYGEIKVKPSDYTASNGNGSVYIYAVDYAGNISSVCELEVKQNNNIPSITITDMGNSVEIDGKRYFNNNTEINFSVIDNSASIRYFGLYDSFDKADNQYFNYYSVANSIKEITDATTYPMNKNHALILKLINYGQNSYIDGSDGKEHDNLAIAVWNWNYQGRYYCLPSGNTNPMKWVYDCSVKAPSGVSVTDAGLYLKTETNTVYYRNGDTSINLKIDFPADDPTGIKGYIIQTGSTKPDTVTAFATGEGKIPAGGTANSTVTRTIPVTVSGTTPPTSIKIYAVDGLGNETKPEQAYTVNLVKVTNAANVTRIKKDNLETDITVAGPGAKSVPKSNKIYVNGKATSITIKPEFDGDDTGIVGFALSATGKDFFPKGADGSYTITFSDSDLPSDANGSYEYTIFARNGLGLYSASGYPLTIVRDVTGPKVNKLQLAAPTPMPNSLVGKLNYIESDTKLYYNKQDSGISYVSKSDNLGGVGPVTEYYSLTTTKTDTAPATNANLGNLNDFSSTTVYVVAKDELENVEYTPLSEIEITIPDTSSISGETVKINGSSSSPKIFTFVYDKNPPKNVSKVSLPANTEGNGLHFDKDTNTLYYNTTKFDSTSVVLTPGQDNDEALDANPYGFKIDGTVTEGSTITVPLLSAEKITIYAVDKCGNDSETGYELKLKAVNAPSITDLSKDSDNKHVITITGATGIDFNEVTGPDGYPVININDKVETITVTPVVSEGLGEDVSVMKGFASSASEEPAAANTNSYTITVDLIEAAKDGGQVCKIYAVNKLGLRSEKPYKITVVLDNKGPVVSEITLTASEGKYINYYGEGTTKSLYYNDSAATVTVNKVDADTVGKYAITNSSTQPDESEFKDKDSLTLGELTDVSSTGIYIWAKDMLGNFEKTPLSKIKIKIPATSTKNIAEGETEVVIHDESSSTVSFTVTYDGTKPKNVTKVTLPTDKEGNGLHFDGENNVLYYNTEKLGATTLKLTPVQEEGKDTNHYGFIVDGTLKTDADVTVDFSANPETLKIIAEDLAGNVSDEYTLTLKAVNKPSITGLTLKEGSETEHKIDIEGDDGKDFNEVTKSESNLVININDKVKKITVTPVVNQGSGISVMKGFASSASEEPADGNTNTYTITVDKTEAEKPDGQVCTIYAVNKLGLRSENPYTITVFLDTTGPVVSEITLTASDTGKYINYYGEGTDKFLYYNDKDAVVTIAENGVDADTDGKYAITDTNAPETAPELKETLKLGDLTGSSTGLYIAAKDKLGNPSYTPLNKIKINIPKASTINIAADKDKVEIPASTEAAPLTFTFAYDGEIPGCPVNIDAPADKVGKGMWKSEPGTGIGTMYYNTDLLKEADSTILDGTIYLKVTFPSDNTGIVGYKLQYNSTTDPISETNLFGTAIPAGATGNDSVRDIPVVITSNTLVRVFAVDMAGNVKIDDEDNPANYVIRLTKDDTAAKTIEQVIGDYANGSILMGKGPGGDVTYYKSDLELKLKLEPKGSPIVAYGVAYTVNNDVPVSTETVWTDFDSPISSISDSVSISIGEIKSAKTSCSLWIKDKVGNIKAYLNDNNNKNRGNALGNPSSKTNLSSTYWHLYEKTDYILTSNEMDGNTLKLKGFKNSTPIKSLKFTGMIFGAEDMQLDGKIKIIQSDDTTRQSDPGDGQTNISKDKNGAYTLTLKSENAYMVKDLEIKFNSGAFYFGEDAKVVVTTGFKTGDENDTVTIGLSKTLPATYNYTYDSENKSLKFTGLLSKYNMNHFYIEGISFSDNTADGKVASVKVGETVETNCQFRKDGDKYDIQFNNNPGPSADSLTINFDVEPTLTDTLTISVQRWDLKNAVTLTAIKSGSNPSIFSRLLDNVSSGISSIFSGRSMTHEELEALKEAKAEKARARAAEKAAKKAAKKAARDAKKNAEIASASPNQGESWSGLSSEFESASSELDSALARMKEGAAPDSGAQDELSSKKSIIKVKSERRNAVSNSRNLITDSHVEKSENHDNRMIYIIGFLAVFGVISGIFAKKMLKKRSKN